MLLSAIMTELTDETAASAALISLGDLVLAAEVETVRVLHGETVGEYISGAIQRFARLASDEEWLQLIGALERSTDPAKTCLVSMLRWSLARDARETVAEGPSPGCSCGNA